MRDHTLVNEIWDEGQLGAVEGVLGTVDQLIIDRSIMEEVKQHYRNIAVAFYDYKKAYDKVHYDRLTRVYEWIAIPRSVIKLIDELMSRWKTRLEIWNEGKKMISRWIQILCGFLQGVILRLDFVLPKYQFASFSNIVEDRMGEPGTGL